MNGSLDLMGPLLGWLDKSVLILARDGRIRLATPQARRLLKAYFGSRGRAGDAMPDLVRKWLQALRAIRRRAKGLSSARRPLVVTRNARRLVAKLAFDSECLIVVLQEERLPLRATIEDGLGLTRREAEVLAWVARGKTNAEIGAILAVSPRTVQKHLERVYRKLGVETRTAAAALLQPAVSGHRP